MNENELSNLIIGKAMKFIRNLARDYWNLPIKNVCIMN